MPPMQKQGTGTAPDDKTDPRQPDTTADKRADSPAHPTDLDVDETNEDVNVKYGFSTIDTSDVDHSKGEIPEPEMVDQLSGSAAPAGDPPKNSTFASRRAASEGRSDTRATGVTSK